MCYLIVYIKLDIFGAIQFILITHIDGSHPKKPVFFAKVNCAGGGQSKPLYIGKGVTDVNVAGQGINRIKMFQSK